MDAEGRPEYLLDRAKGSLKKLRIERIDLWQLHRIDAAVPREEQFGAVKMLLDQGLIAHAGLSEVSVEDIKAARKVFPVATVQNRYNLVDRGSEDVLDYCEREGIGFIPWYPLAAGELARPGSILGHAGHEYGATPGQIALAWVLKRSPVMLPIPGTSKVKHLEENVAAASIVLDEGDFVALDRSGSRHRAPNADANPNDLSNWGKCSQSGVEGQMIEEMPRLVRQPIRRLAA